MDGLDKWPIFLSFISIHIVVVIRQNKSLQPWLAALLDLWDLISNRSFIFVPSVRAFRKRKTYYQHTHLPYGSESTGFRQGWGGWISTDGATLFGIWEIIPLDWQSDSQRWTPDGRMRHLPFYLIWLSSLFSFFFLPLSLARSLTRIYSGSWFIMQTYSEIGEDGWKNMSTGRLRRSRQINKQWAIEMPLAIAKQFASRDGQCRPVDVKDFVPSKSGFVFSSARMIQYNVFCRPDCRQQHRRDKLAAPGLVRNMSRPKTICPYRAASLDELGKKREKIWANIKDTGHIVCNPVV